MFFDTLSENTIRDIYTSLIKILGKFEYTKENVKSNLYKFCKARDIPFDHQCLSKVIDKQIIKTDTSYLPISDSISGFYVSHFNNKDEKHFGDSAIKQLLNKHKNKHITILIIESE